DDDKDIAAGTDRGLPFLVQRVDLRLVIAARHRILGKDRGHQHRIGRPGGDVRGQIVLKRGGEIVGGQGRRGGQQRGKRQEGQETGHGTPLLNWSVRGRDTASARFHRQVLPGG